MRFPMLRIVSAAVAATLFGFTGLASAQTAGYPTSTDRSISVPTNRGHEQNYRGYDQNYRGTQNSRWGAGQTGSSTASNTMRDREYGAARSKNQFASETEANSSCRGDTVVWVNTKSHVYHFAGSHSYGTPSTVLSCAAPMPIAAEAIGPRKTSCVSSRRLIGISPRNPGRACIGNTQKETHIREVATMPMFLSDALDALLQFQQALDTSRSSGWLGSSPSGGGSYPPLNVFRQGDDIVVIAEVPGVRKSDLQIEVKGRTIRIAGAKSVGYGKKTSTHRRERLAGSFDRAI